MTRRCPRSTLWPLVSVLAVLCLGSGCNSVAERVAGWYITRKVDSYLDLESGQKRWFRTRVDHHLQRIRRQELRRWVALGKDARSEVVNGSSDARIAALQGRYDALLLGEAKLLMPDMAALFARLDDRQIRVMETEVLEALDARHEDLRDERKAPARARARTWEKLEDTLEDLLGDLEEAQLTRLRALSEQFVDDRSNLYRASKERVTELAGLLHTHPGPAAIERRLWQMWDTRFSSLGPDRSLAARRAEQRRFLLALDALVTPAQRAHMLEEIDDRLEQAISFQLPPES